MKNLLSIDQFLLPVRYRKYGMYLLIGGVPAMLLFFSVIVINVFSAELSDYWNLFGGYLLHLPLSLGLYWTLFSKENEEDEFYLSLRMKATFHGIRFIFIAIFFLPAFSLVKAYFTNTSPQLPDIGGNLAVVTLMLLYANLAYWWLKKKMSDEE